MFSFVSQFGAISLAAQEELRRSVDRSGGMPRVANFVVARLDREKFLREQGSLERGAIDRFRGNLRREIEVFLEANEWGIGGPPSINILLDNMDGPGDVRVEYRQTLYWLRIRDDRGKHIVPVRWPAVIVGRDHESPPRSFVPVHDSSLSLSREHLILTFRDLEVYGTLRGKNPTTLNSEPFPQEREILLHSGDTIRCGPHTIVLELEEPNAVQDDREVGGIG